VGVALVLLFSEHLWQKGGWTDVILHVFGFALTGASAFGRIWVSVYASGHKNKELIIVGPYSMVRNPLYFFSFIGALGIGCASESIVILLLITLAFTIIYPQVVVAEEENLLRRFGEP
jgi:protein-S-isoprenylcysteine O-methyltransferase Ste14